MSHFLSAVLRASSRSCSIHNRRTRRPLALKVSTAFDSASRRRGLLGRDGLEPGSGMVLAPCSSIHTFFMRFPIDVVFVGRDGRVVKVYAKLAPWRLAFAFSAYAAIELQSGAVGQTETRVGDVVDAIPHDSSEGAREGQQRPE